MNNEGTEIRLGAGGEKDVFHHTWVDGLAGTLWRTGMRRMEQMITKVSPNPQTLELQDSRGILLHDTGQLPKTPECLPGKLCVSHALGEQRIKTLPLVNYNDLVLMTLEISSSE